MVVAGSPRSGTTWFLELLRTLPGYKAMNEPLMYEEARNGHGFSWRTHLDPGAEAEAKRAYLGTILTGQLGISPAWYFEADSRPAQLVEHATRDRLVVKFCRLNRMLHWFCGQFDVRGPVFIVRHPCAVVASMLRHEAWNEDDLRGPTRVDHALHGGSLPDSLRAVFGPVLDRIENKVEVLATMWCLDHYVPLIHHADGLYPWVLVPYERMVRRGREELRRITTALDVEVTREMRNQLDEPSGSVRDQFHQDVERQLSKWRRRLSDRQVDDVLRIVDDVGLSSIYSDDLEPDYDHLNKFQRPATRW
ncbi:hypothetical protein BRC21_01065 [Candidatus Saccharibacteria bacterium SW_7_54_9]|nr:MAG: hypothetical protein BRC21_01065 [Candidatus Saccharibacteria bacterium SW_7_54_9]